MDARSLIDALERTGDQIVRALGGVPQELVHWKDGERRWSLLEIACHLVDEEVEDFRTRLRITLEDPRAPWPRIDPEGWVLAREYAARDLEEVRGRFVREPADSLTWLRGLGEIDWAHAHEHPDLGTLRAGDLLTSWAAHDVLHLRQLLGLAFRRIEQDAHPFGAGYAGTW